MVERKEIKPWIESYVVTFGQQCLSGVYFWYLPAQQPNPGWRLATKQEQ
jgi:hypothetical protein